MVTITAKQSQFITENRFRMSIKDISNHLGISCYLVRTYMVKYELSVSSYRSNRIRREKNKKKKEKNTYQRKLSFAKKSGFKNLTEAIAAMGKSSFEEAYNA